MRKRLSLLICCVISFIVLMAALCACDTAHEHEFSQDWKYDDTYHWHYCNSEACNEISDKAEHKWEIEITTQPTCTQDGEEIKTCSICGYITTESIPAQHDFEFFEGETPTCTTAGCNDYGVCRICGYSDFEELPATGHDLEYVQGKDAGCTEEGWKDYEYCLNCEYSTKQIIEPLGHDWITIAAKDPGCVLPGYEEYEKCARCGLDTGYTAIPALGHDIVHVEEKLPTCTETGWEAYEHCKRCEYTTLDELLKPLGHDLADHECTRCDKDLYGGRLYGYEYLGTMQNGANRQAFYDELAAAAKAFDKDTSTDMDTEEDQPFAHILFTQYGLSLEDAVVIWKTFKDDNPVYYWMSNVLYY